MKFHRVQGDAWRQLRKEKKLKLLCISASKSNNWLADLVDENGRHYRHWLGDIERERLINSDYFLTHKILNSDEVYNPQSEAIKLMVKGEEANLSEVPYIPEPRKNVYPF